MKAVASGFIALAIPLLVACHESVAPDQTVLLEVIKLEAPAVIGPGSSLPVVITVGVACGLSFDHFVEERSSSEVTLAAKGRVFDRPDACIDVLVPEQHSYEIKQPLPTRFTVVVKQPANRPPLTAEVETGFAID